jgi:hypothetical protein
MAPVAPVLTDFCLHKSQHLLIRMFIIIVVAVVLVVYERVFVVLL